jgi:hypothetical protein
MNDIVERLRNRTGNICHEAADTIEQQAAEIELLKRSYLEQVAVLYSQVLRCEKPTLKSLEVKGDPKNPLHIQAAPADLSGLPKEDLHALARILPKLGGSIRSDALGGDLSRTTPGTAPPPRKRRTPRRRA